MGTPRRFTAFCAKHGYSGRGTGEQLLARLRAAPAGTLEESLCEAVRDAVFALVTVLNALARRSIAALAGATAVGGGWAGSAGQRLTGHAPGDKPYPAGVGRPRFVGRSIGGRTGRRFRVVLNCWRSN